MKKMRRMIPALCMLLVSAIMLSTASYAWFTMNESVTATGMQIQAQGDSSLLISQSPISGAAAGAGNVEVDTTIHNLKPMAYRGTAGTLGTTGDKGWHAPANNEHSNVATGQNYGPLDAIETLGEYGFVEEFYIATAGESMTGYTLNIELSSPTHAAGSKIHNAFAAAIYVFDKTDEEWAADADIDLFDAAVEPDAIAYVGEDKHIVNIANVTIPSIAGAIDDGSSVGLKVVVLFYIDGALQSTNSADKVTLIHGQEHTKVTGAFDPEATYYSFTPVAEDDIEVGETVVTGYYVESNGKYVPAVGVAATGTTYFVRVSPTISSEDRDSTNLTSKNWYVAGTVVREEVFPCYVRSSDVPSTGSTLKLTFKSIAPANGGNGEQGGETPDETPEG